MRNNTSSFSKYEGRTIEDLKSSQRAIERSIDNYHMEFAKLVGILPLKSGRKFWILGELDINDPRINPAQRERYLDLVTKNHNLLEYIGRQEAIRDDDLPRYLARKKANIFLTTNFNSFEEEAQWLQQHGLNGLTLAEKILENPDFLEEVTL